jgi:glycosyltransferase involved in cell wall biosynthesis
MEKVSVIIPCYNAERFVARTLTSVLAQSFMPAEIIAIDDGSTDRTMQLIAQYPVRLIRVGSNQGAIAARNLGYREAKYELIASIDADCEASCTWLEELVKGLPDDCAGTSGMTIEANVKMPADRWRSFHMPLHWGSKPRNNPKVVYGTNHIFRKSALVKAGLADPTRVARDYKIGAGDWALTRRIYAAGFKLFYNPRAIVYHLRTDTPISIIRTYWRWSVFYYREPTSLLAFSYKLGINLLKSVKHMADDCFRREWSLVGISALIFPFHTYYDMQHLRKSGRSRKQTRP